MMYQLVPKEELPTLDLSVAITTRVLSSRADAVFNKLTRRYRLLILTGQSITCVIYALVMIIPVDTGCTLAVIGVIMGIPSILTTIGVLRFDVVKLLVRSFDAMSTMLATWVSVWTTAAIYGDVRGLLSLCLPLSSACCIFIDANIRGVRQVAIGSVIALLSFGVMYCVITMDLPSRLSNPIILEYKKQHLRAKSVAMDGSVSLGVVLARNLYRSRDLLLKRTDGSVIECVSYRCRLKLRPVGMQTSPTSAETASSVDPTSPIQQMRYVPTCLSINAHHIFLPSLLPHQPRVFDTRLLFVARQLKVAAFVGAVSTGILDFVTFVAPNIELASSSVQGHCRLASLFLTLSWCAFCTGCYQRRILFEICTSFDFVFLTAHATFVHIALADLFRWQPSCLILATSWLWLLWVLCFDALTPLARDWLGLRVRHAAYIFTLICLCLPFVVYLVVFARTADQVRDRMLWSLSWLGGQMEFRLLSLFYSSFVTVAALKLRVAWRLWHSNATDLIVLDGKVVYTNYLRRHTEIKRSRRGNTRRVLAKNVISPTTSIVPVRGASQQGDLVKSP